MRQAARRIVLCLVVFQTALFAAQGQRKTTSLHSGAATGAWSFAYAGDSRNCGDVVMPAIAAGALRDHASFYWHLGDYRANTNIDQDIHQLNPNLTKDEYLKRMWPDFIQNQLVPFGDLPVRLGIGNHELVPPRTRGEFLAQFADWFDAPPIKAQRLRDDASDHLLKTYYHWIQNGVDFVTLDNASAEQFDSDQVQWFEGVLKRAASNPAVRSVVVGMHDALPDSVSAGHSMNESEQGTISGRRVYNDLAAFRKSTRKHVYVLASHSHFVMDNVYDTACRRANKQEILTGWIVGTAGATRYRLPQEHSASTIAKTDVYGYVLATVSPDGSMQFQFKQLSPADIPRSVVERYSGDFVNQCFSGNQANYVPAGPVQPPQCPQ